ncbi:unnamed protein product, partial [Rotaria magnacalcarata]
MGITCYSKEETRRHISLYRRLSPPKCRHKEGCLSTAYHRRTAESPSRTPLLHKTRSQVGVLSNPHIRSRQGEDSVCNARWLIRIQCISTRLDECIAHLSACDEQSDRHETMELCCRLPGRYPHPLRLNKGTQETRGR